MRSLIRKYGFHKTDMCAFGLRCPKNHKPIKKRTGIVCSDPEFVKFVRTCPGNHEHQQNEGSIDANTTRCAFSAQYTQEFVRTIWECLGPESSAVLHVQSPPVDWASIDCECLAARREPEDPDANRKVDTALKKLHANLGHPSSRELIRVLKHSGASSHAIERANKLQCSVCMNHQRPSAPLPANTDRAREFNDRVGLDVKHVQGWQAGHKQVCVNIVDYATSFQVMVPIGRRETGELLRNAFCDKWLSFAGPPKTLVLDPGRPNLGTVFNDFCEQQGISVEQTAAESHWQLGKVERHGQWFSRILDRISDEVRPLDEEEHNTCIVQAQSAKNALLTEAGKSPYQLVFGRSPRVPGDVLQEQPNPVVSDAIEFDSLLQKANSVRQAARKAVLECQDDRALRAALRARPRLLKPFKKGDWVYYWRTQKYVGGVRVEGGRWYGAAMILGHIGKNLIVAHRRSILRCSPEHLRHASQEEASVAEFPHNELLGIKNLLERGQFPKSQFEDLVSQPPPQIDVEDQELQGPLNAAQCLEQQSRDAQAARQEVLPRAVHASPDHSAAVSGQSSGLDSVPSEVTPTSDVAMGPAQGIESYGPARTRHRITQKTRPNPILHRFQVTQPEDFMKLMQEVVPRIIEQAVSSEAAQSVPAESDPTDSSPRGNSQKRAASREPPIEPATTFRRAMSDEEAEVMYVEARSHESYFSSEVEALMAAFMQKRMQKELPATGNEPQLQSEIDGAKTLEWETVCGKQAVRVWTGAEAKRIRERHPDRFVGSRFVITRKTDEDGSRIKARICLQGHSDPDFHQKILSGLCHSPTLSQMGRSVLLQLLVSNHWIMNLGDIKGAFMEAGPIPQQFRPLYAHQPAGGVPGLGSDDVIEVVGNLYGSNDAPFQWFQTFDQEAKASGFEQSTFDKCLYFFRANGCLTGVLGAHVDDTITGGAGPEYQAAIARLKHRFPYRKWRVGSGEFCGVMYTQDPQSFEISYQQAEYARHLRPISMTKERRQARESAATDREVNAPSGERCS